MDKEPLLKIIKNRRSIRQFQDKKIDAEKIHQILEAGRWAPSGLNNQPWRFMVVTKGEDEKEREILIKNTVYGDVLEEAAVNIVVFLDQEESYNRVKDIQGIGACIQNMLLMAHVLGIGGCWQGEILNKREKVEKELEVPDNYELMAVVTLGHPAKKSRTSSRKELEELLYG